MANFVSEVDQETGAIAEKETRFEEVSWDRVA